MEHTEECAVCGRDMEYAGQVGNKLSFVCECGQRMARRAQEEEATEGDRMGANYARYGVPVF